MKLLTTTCRKIEYACFNYVLDTDYTEVILLGLYAEEFN